MSKRIFLSLLIIGALFFGFSCRSKTVVKRLVNKNADTTSKAQTKKIDGVMYHLPKTVVQVTVPVQKISKAPGDFVKFAPCFFSKSEREGMVTEENEGNSFSINSPAFSSRGIPDTSQTYVISTKGKYFESKTLFVEYAPGYVLQKGEAESKNETLEFTVKAIATAASIAAKISPLAIGTTDEENKKLIEEFREEYNCFQELENEGIAGAATSKMEVVKIMERILKAKTSALPAVAPVAPLAAPTPEINLLIQQDENRIKYQRALLTFKQLKALEGQRNQILSSGTNTNIPPETYKLMLEKNAEAIASYRAAFLGSKSKEVWSATFEFAPETDDAYSPLIFTYSQKYGVCNDGLLKNKSIPIGSGFEFSKPDANPMNDPEKCGDTTEANIKALWLKVGKSGDPNKNLNLNKVREATANDENQDKSRGWFYRVPADGEVVLLKSEIPCQSVGAKYNCLPLSVIVTSANITVNQAGGVVFTKANDNEQIAISEMQIAQLGVVASVPASTAGRSSSTAIMLDPATGAMKNYKSSSTALIDKSILDDAQKAANSTIDAVDPLNKKKRELEELKTQNQINDEKKKLTNTNTNTTTANDDNQQ